MRVDTHGVIGIGDSITVGSGAWVGRLPCRSWAEWLALTAGWCFTNLSAGGVTTAQILDRQVPRIRGRYEVAAVSVGTNDLLAREWDASRWADTFSALCEELLTVADRVLVLSIPDRLARVPGGWSPSRERIDEANAVITDGRVSVVDVRDLRGLRMLRPDRVHPTAVGQLEVADRAARLLGLSMPSADAPSVRLTAVNVGRLARDSVEATVKGAARASLRR